MRLGSKKFDTTNKNKVFASIHIDTKLWTAFDELIEQEFGKYKKSLVIEFLIRDYIKNKKGVLS